METILRFRFEHPSDAEVVEADVALALFAVECLYGQTRVRLEASYLVADDGSTCVLRIDGKAGEAGARIFAGITAARVGAESFRVERLTASTTTSPAGTRSP